MGLFNSIYIAVEMNITLKKIKMLTGLLLALSAIRKLSICTGCLRDIHNVRDPHIEQSAHQ